MKTWLGAAAWGWDHVARAASGIGWFRCGSIRRRLECIPAGYSRIIKPGNQLGYIYIRIKQYLPCILWQVVSKIIPCYRSYKGVINVFSWVPVECNTGET